MLRIEKHFIQIVEFENTSFGFSWGYKYPLVNSAIFVTPKQ